MNWESVERKLLEEEMVADPVRNLQHMLRRISYRHPFLPELQPNSRFDDRTLEAVMLFQKYFSPPVTGVVDQQTWQAIRDEWLDVERELADPRSLRGFPQQQQASVGESKEFLYVAQAMFQTLSRLFDGVQEERIDGIQSGNSVDNTLWLQKRAGLPATGDMNRDTWDALVRLYELFVIREPHGDKIVPALGRG